MPKLAPTESAWIDADGGDVLQLIADYRRAASMAVNGLKLQSDAADLLRAWRAGELPKSGPLKSPKGRYTFHGVGCRFQIARRIIDVDFGPNGRHDGFDSPRLSLYAESSFEWNDFTPERIEEGLLDLEAAGLIVKPESEPSPHLYYLRRPSSKV